MLLPLLLTLLPGSFLRQRSLPVLIELEIIQNRRFRSEALKNIQHPNTLLKLHLHTPRKPCQRRFCERHHHSHHSQNSPRHTQINDDIWSHAKSSIDSVPNFGGIMRPVAISASTFRYLEKQNMINSPPTAFHHLPPLIPATTHHLLTDQHCRTVQSWTLRVPPRPIQLIYTAIVRLGRNLTSWVSLLFVTGLFSLFSKIM
jgi:hypothetical protein